MMKFFEKNDDGGFFFFLKMNETWANAPSLEHEFLKKS